jgi:hypothetical protein
LLACELFGLFHAAELLQRFNPRLVRRHPGSQIALKQPIEMLLDLLRHFGVASLLSKQPEQSPKPGVESRHKI